MPSLRLRVAATKGIPVSVFSLLAESGISMGVVIDFTFVFHHAEALGGRWSKGTEGSAKQGKALVWCVYAM